jgi:DNA-directed RNA polymerase specialized sigma24 family protein
VTDSEHELLPAIAAGDPGAFARWMARAERPLRESLRSFAARVDVEAIVQETLLRAWQVAPRVHAEGQPGKPNPLLRVSLRIARNLAIDAVRRARTVAVGDDAIDQAQAFATLHEVDPMLREAIALCREKLPAQPARALDARMDAAGADPDALLAERLGMKLNTFLQNFTRARRLLAECLRARGVELPGSL